MTNDYDFERLFVRLLELLYNVIYKNKYYCKSLNQILNVFNKRCGFYSYVFLTKGENND